MCSVNRAIKMFKKLYDIKNKKFVDVTEFDEAAWYNKIKTGEKFCIAKKIGDDYIPMRGSPIKL